MPPHRRLSRTSKRCVSNWRNRKCLQNAVIGRQCLSSCFRDLSLHSHSFDSFDTRVSSCVSSLPVREFCCLSYLKPVKLCEMESTFSEKRVARGNSPRGVRALGSKRSHTEYRGYAIRWIALAGSERATLGGLLAHIHMNGQLRTSIQPERTKAVKERLNNSCGPFCCNLVQSIDALFSRHHRHQYKHFDAEKQSPLFQCVNVSSCVIVRCPPKVMLDVTRADISLQPLSFCRDIAKLERRLGLHSLPGNRLESSLLS